VFPHLLGKDFVGGTKDFGWRESQDERLKPSFGIVRA